MDIISDAMHCAIKFLTPQPPPADGDARRRVPGPLRRARRPHDRRLRDALPDRFPPGGAHFAGTLRAGRFFEAGRFLRVASPAGGWSGLVVSRPTSAAWKKPMPPCTTTPRRRDREISSPGVTRAPSGHDPLLRVLEPQIAAQEHNAST